MICVRDTYQVDLKGEFAAFTVEGRLAPKITIKSVKCEDGTEANVCFAELRYRIEFDAPPGTLHGQFSGVYGLSTITSE